MAEKIEDQGRRSNKERGEGVCVGGGREGEGKLTIVLHLLLTLPSLLDHLHSREVNHYPEAELHFPRNSLFTRPWTEKKKKISKIKN